MKRADEIGKSEHNRSRSHMRSFRVVPQECPKIPRHVPKQSFSHHFPNDSSSCSCAFQIGLKIATIDSEII